MLYYLGAGELVKRLNTPPFHGGIHGFESRTRHLKKAHRNMCFFIISILKTYCISNIIMVYYLSVGELVKRLNTPPFHGGTHGFESRTRHFYFLGVSYNGSTSVSKTADGSSILSTPA